VNSTVNRKDITLTEETELSYSFDTAHPETVSWVASFFGETSTGETVDISRSSKSANEALLLLENALVEQGWKLQ
jgi:hypothetical protein